MQSGTLRIAHVITRMIVGGAQENTLLCCHDLHARYGDEVLLATGPETGPEGDLFAHRPDLGVPTATVGPMRRAIVPWSDWRAARALRRILADFRPHVVHTHSAKAGFLGRMVAWRLGVPAVVHTVHGAPFHPFQPAAARALFRKCERWAARRCHKLICVADAMVERLVRAHVCRPEKCVVIPSGMEVEPFLGSDRWREETRQRLGFGPEHVVVGKIARLFRLKGHDDLIEAAARLARRFPHVRFLLVGDGILRERLERTIRQHELADRFVFTGLVPPGEIPHLVSAMDLVVHTSLREGLARALPQALLAGKPVVSYDIDGAREVVQSNRTGFLVPARDQVGLVEAMARLIEDPDLRRRLGQAGRHLCRRRFDHRSMTDQIRAVYEGILASTLSGRSPLK